jgi:hypothetical protein
MSKTARTVQLLTGLLLGLVAGGALLTAQSTPTAALKAYYEAVKAKDAVAFKHALSAASQKMLETPQLSVESMLASLARDLPATAPESRNEKVVGDKATLDVHDVKRGRWETMTFVREQGQWKLALDGTDKNE